MTGRRGLSRRLVDLALAGPRGAIVATSRTAEAIGSILRQVGGKVEAELSDAGSELLTDTSDGESELDTVRVAATVDVAATDLALDDYDRLAARQIVDRLDDLTDAELDLIGAYEQANRHRRTVLGKIDQLRS